MEVRGLKTISLEKKMNDINHLTAMVAKNPHIRLRSALDKLERHKKRQQLLDEMKAAGEVRKRRMGKLHWLQNNWVKGIMG